MSIRMVDLHYAAGFLEGEGSFTVAGLFDPRISAGQVELDPIEKLQKLFGGHIYPVKLAKNSRQQAHVWTLYGARSIGLMLTLFPLMSRKRQGQITKAVNGWRSRPGKNTCLDDFEAMPLLRRVCAGEQLYVVAKSANVHGKTLSDWLHGKERQHLLAQLRQEVPADILASIHSRRWQEMSDESIFTLMREAKKLRELGQDYKKISTNLGITHTTLQRWMRGESHPHLLAALTQEGSSPQGG